MIWKRLTNEPITDIEEQLLIDISQSKHQDLKFYIGGDSQYRCNSIKYCIVLVMNTEGKGARGYYTTIIKKGRISRQQRLFKETYYSVKYALKFNPILESIGYNISEIHTDLNPNTNYLSSYMITSCIGYIRGMGFVGKTKPESWASYGVADIKTK